jgi:hypothetical protein
VIVARARRYVGFVLAICFILLVLNMVHIGTTRQKHLQIEIRLSRYNAKAEAVCLVTFSNTSSAVIVCASDFDIEFMTNGIWTSTSFSEPGGMAGPFLPHQVSQKTIVLGTNAAVVRVKQTYECLPFWVESLASNVRGQKSWKLAYRLFKKRTKTDNSNVYVIPSRHSERQRIETGSEQNK